MMRLAVCLALAILLVPGCLEAKPAAQDFIQMYGDGAHGVSADCDKKARVEVTDGYARGEGYRITLRDGSGSAIWTHDAVDEGSQSDIRSTVTGQPGTWRLEGRAVGGDEYRGGNYAYLRLLCL